MDIFSIAIKIDESDNVGTVLQSVEKGSLVIVKNGRSEFKIKAMEQIQKGHKIALLDIKQNGLVLKYGETIGIATKSTKAGECVSSHNLRSTRSKLG